MESLTIEERSGEGLATSLVRIASHPSQVVSLHELLGPFCHHCRNLLNSVKLSLYLAQRGVAAEEGPWCEVADRYRVVERYFDRLQTICRPMSLAPIRVPLAVLIDDRRGAWAESLARRGGTLECLAPAEPACGQFDPIQLGHALDAFVGWRAESGPADATFRLGWWAESGEFHLDWDEGLSSDDGTAATEEGGPDALALPLLVRVVSAHGGQTDLSWDEGFHLRIRWPIDLRAS